MLCLYLGFCLMCGVSCSTSSTSTNDLSQPSILSNDSSLPSSVAARLTCITLMLIYPQNLDIDMEILYSLRHTVTWIIPSLMDIMRVEISARGTTRRTGSPRKNVTLSVHVSYKVHYFICILWCLGPMCSVEWILLKYAIRQRCLACSIIVLHREYTYLENNALIICIDNTSKSETE